MTIRRLPWRRIEHRGYGLERAHEIAVQATGHPVEDGVGFFTSHRRSVGPTLDQSAIDVAD
ncbi:hypothetical protein, partial [Methylobacterium sp. J-030]|uniref:hypothetical protein n=1 Tax=Methylobacterium sp. J-030 TaxID=2836627 RepID=UPI0028C4C226